MRSLIAFVVCASVLASAPYSWGSLGHSVDEEEDAAGNIPPLNRVNAISFELNGRAGTYALNFDHLFEPYFALGAGVSSFTVYGPTSDDHSQALLVPVYANVYQSWATSRGFFTAGTNLSNTARRPPGFGYDANPKTGAYLTLGLGYEYRGAKALLFRGTLYTLSSNLTPWAAASLGYSF